MRVWGWLALTILVGVSIGIILNPGDDLFWTALNNSASLSASTWATVSAVGAASRSRSREKVAWSIMAAGSALWVLGQIVWSWYLLALKIDPPMASWMDVLFLAAPVLWAVSMLAFVVTPAGVRSQIRGALEALMVLGAAFLPAWFLILQPVAAESAESRAVVVVNLFYPVLDMFVLGAALFTLTRPRLGGSGRLGVVGWGLLIMSAADATYWYLTTSGNFQNSNATDALWIIGFGVMALGSRSTLGTRPEERTLRKRWWLTMSPNLVYAVGLITTFAALAFPGGRRTTGWEFMGIVALLSVGTIQRFAVMIENHFLASGLEKTVAERTNELAVRERYFHALVRESSDIVAVVDDSHRILWVSNAARALYGIAPSDLIGTSVDERPGLKALSLAIESQVPQVQWQLQDAHGRTRWASSTISDLRSDPDVGAFVINTRDVTDQLTLEDQLRHQAFHDPLTGLPNRALFADRVNHALKRAQTTDTMIGVALIDLNGFKRVNDSHGHHAGDSVLVAVANQLSRRLGPDITVARLGGDEFAVLFESIESREDAKRLGNDISEHLRHQVSLGATEFETSGSVGVAMAKGSNAVSVDDLLRDADIAMYRAKESKSRGAMVFAEEMHHEAQERFALESDLGNALHRGELRAFYQPVHSLSGGVILGFEALIRWEHPAKGLVPPFDFIPLAEATGLIVPIGEWMIGTAVRQLAEWSRAFQDRGSLGMSINVSVGQLMSDRIIDVLRNEIDAANIVPGRVTIEITESMVVTENHEVVERLQRISDLGVRLAIDDFGTGYASIANLRRLPIDVLKVDRQFVSEASTSREDLLAPILQIGEAFGLTTVAEGIETSGQMQRLRELGCQLGQGFLFSPPVPATEARELLIRQFSDLEGQSFQNRLRLQPSTIAASSPWTPGR